MFLEPLMELGEFPAPGFPCGPDPGSRCGDFLLDGFLLFGGEISNGIPDDLEGRALPVVPIYNAGFAGSLRGGRRCRSRGALYRAFTDQKSNSIATEKNGQQRQCDAEIVFEGCFHGRESGGGGSVSAGAGGKVGEEGGRDFSRKKKVM